MPAISPPDTPFNSSGPGKTTMAVRSQGTFPEETQRLHLLRNARARLEDKQDIVSRAKSQLVSRIHEIQAEGNQVRRDIWMLFERVREEMDRKRTTLHMQMDTVQSMAMARCRKYQEELENCMAHLLEGSGGISVIAEKRSWKHHLRDFLDSLEGPVDAVLQEVEKLREQDTPKNYALNYGDFSSFVESIALRPTSSEKVCLESDPRDSAPEELAMLEAEPCGCRLLSPSVPVLHADCPCCTGAVKGGASAQESGYQHTHICIQGCPGCKDAHLQNVLHMDQDNGVVLCRMPVPSRPPEDAPAPQSQVENMVGMELDLIHCQGACEVGMCGRMDETGNACEDGADISSKIAGHVKALMQDIKNAGAGPAAVAVGLANQPYRLASPPAQSIGQQPGSEGTDRGGGPLAAASQQEVMCTHLRRHAHPDEGTHRTGRTAHSERVTPGGVDLSRHASPKHAQGECPPASFPGERLGTCNVDHIGPVVSSSSSWTFAAGRTQRLRQDAACTFPPASSMGNVASTERQTAGRVPSCTSVPPQQSGSLWSQVDCVSASSLESLPDALEGHCSVVQLPSSGACLHADVTRCGRNVKVSRVEFSESALNSRSAGGVCEEERSIPHPLSDRTCCGHFASPRQRPAMHRTSRESQGEDLLLSLPRTREHDVDASSSFRDQEESTGTASEGTGHRSTCTTSAMTGMFADDLQCRQGHFCPNGHSSDLVQSRSPRVCENVSSWTQRGSKHPSPCNGSLNGETPQERLRHTGASEVQSSREASPLVAKEQLQVTRDFSLSMPSSPDRFRDDIRTTSSGNTSPANLCFQRRSINVDNWANSRSDLSFHSMPHPCPVPSPICEHHTAMHTGKDRESSESLLPESNCHRCPKDCREIPSCQKSPRPGLFQFGGSKEHPLGTASVSSAVTEDAMHCTDAVSGRKQRNLVETMERTDALPREIYHRPMVAEGTREGGGDDTSTIISRHMNALMKDLERFRSGVGNVTTPLENSPGSVLSPHQHHLGSHPAGARVTGGPDNCLSSHSQVFPFRCDNVVLAEACRSPESRAVFPCSEDGSTFQCPTHEGSPGSPRPGSCVSSHCRRPRRSRPEVLGVSMHCGDRIRDAHSEELGTLDGTELPDSRTPPGEMYPSISSERLCEFAGDRTANACCVTDATARQCSVHALKDNFSPRTSSKLKPSCISLHSAQTLPSRQGLVCPASLSSTSVPGSTLPERTAEIKPEIPRDDILSSMVTSINPGPKAKQHHPLRTSSTAMPDASEGDQLQTTSQTSRAELNTRDHGHGVRGKFHTCEAMSERRRSQKVEGVPLTSMDSAVVETTPCVEHTAAAHCDVAAPSPDKRTCGNNNDKSIPSLLGKVYPSNSRDSFISNPYIQLQESICQRKSTSSVSSTENYLSPGGLEMLTRQPRETLSIPQIVQACLVSKDQSQKNAVSSRNLQPKRISETRQRNVRGATINTATRQQAVRDNGRGSKGDVDADGVKKEAETIELDIAEETRSVQRQNGGHHCDRSARRDGTSTSAPKDKPPPSSARLHPGSGKPEVPSRPSDWRLPLSFCPRRSAEALSTSGHQPLAAVNSMSAHYASSSDQDLFNLPRVADTSTESTSESSSLWNFLKTPRHAAPERHGRSESGGHRCGKSSKPRCSTAACDDPLSSPRELQQETTSSSSRSEVPLKCGSSPDRKEVDSSADSSPGSSGVRDSSSESLEVSSSPTAQCVASRGTSRFSEPDSPGLSFRSDIHTSQQALAPSATSSSSPLSSVSEGESNPWPRQCSLDTRTLAEPDMDKILEEAHSRITSRNNYLEEEFAVPPGCSEVPRSRRESFQVE